MIDAIMAEDDASGVKLGIAALKSSGISKAAMDALRDKTASEFSDLLARWMNAGGVNPGKSE